MAFTESNTVEASFRDLLCGPQQAAPKAVADLQVPYTPAGIAHHGAGWHFATGAALPRQPQDVFVESYVSESLIRLNPAIAAQPERADEVLYKLRAIVLAVRSGSSCLNPRSRDAGNQAATSLFSSRESDNACILASSC